MQWMVSFIIPYIYSSNWFWLFLVKQSFDPGKMQILSYDWRGMSQMLPALRFHCNSWYLLGRTEAPPEQRLNVHGSLVPHVRILAGLLGPNVPCTRCLLVETPLQLACCPHCQMLKRHSISQSTWARWVEYRRGIKLAGIVLKGFKLIISRVRLDT